MIVRPLADRVLLVTQPDHAHLARWIMERCVPLAARPRRESILRATGEHDAAWAELDAAPVVDRESGGVVDFVRLPVADRQGVWPRSVALLADDPWAAALVSQHALTAYERFRGAAEWAAFFVEMEAARDAHLARSGLALADLLADYAFVRLGDMISLAFCTGWPDELRYGQWAVRPEGARIAAAPDPFGGEAIPVAIEAREIERTSFASDDDLRAALRTAPTTSLRGTVTGA